MTSNRYVTSYTGAEIRSKIKIRKNNHIKRVDIKFLVIYNHKL